MAVSIVLAGVDHARYLGVNNSQYANRFNYVVHFNPYVLKLGHPVDAGIFKHRVESVLAALVLPWSNEQPSEDLWLRLHWATRGSIGNLANLTKAAVQYALACDAKALTLEHFSYAYSKKPVEAVSVELGTREPSRADPFRAGFKFPRNTIYSKVESVSDLIRN